MGEMATDNSQLWSDASQIIVSQDDISDQNSHNVLT